MIEPVQLKSLSAHPSSIGAYQTESIPLAVERWLPIVIDHLTIENVLANQVLYPETVPTSFSELMIEQARRIELVRGNNQGQIFNPIESDSVLAELATDEIDLLWLCANSYEIKGVTAVYNKGVAIGVIGIFYSDTIDPVTITIDQGTTETISVRLSPDEMVLLPPQAVGLRRVVNETSIPPDLPFILDGRARPIFSVNESGNTGYAGAKVSTLHTETRQRVTQWRRALGLTVNKRFP